MLQLNIQVHVHIFVSILGFAFFIHLNLRLFQKCVAASILRPQKFLGASCEQNRKKYPAFIHPKRRRQ